MKFRADFLIELLILYMKLPRAREGGAGAHGWLNRVGLGTSLKFSLLVYGWERVHLGWIWSEAYTGQDELLGLCWGMLQDATGSWLESDTASRDLGGCCDSINNAECDHIRHLAHSPWLQNANLICDCMALCYNHHVFLVIIFDCKIHLEQFLQSYKIHLYLVSFLKCSVQ